MLLVISLGQTINKITQKSAIVEHAIFYRLAPSYSQQQISSKIISRPIFFSYRTPSEIQTAAEGDRLGIRHSTCK